MPLRALMGVSVSALDGPVFSRILRSGAMAVFRGQEALDRINVFPVRDADTGANLTATFKAAAARLGSGSPDGVGAAAQAAADGALDGARGNSGAIVAQFLHGLAEGMEGRQEVDGPQFAAATRMGMESAYAALADPREGTILSVLKAWSHELMRRAQAEDLTRRMVGGLEAARRALAETPRQLEVLARNRVVGAGGQGFVYFLEGIHEALHGGDVAWEPVEAAPHGLPAIAADHEIDGAYRFCTEALISPRDGSSLAPDAVAAAVSDLGDSLVVAGGRRRLRVHLHTNEPQRLLATVGALGVIERSKIDDMVLQQLGGRASTIAIVTDSTTDLPEDEAFRLGVVSVPLTLSLGGRDYLDGVDITLDEFIRRVDSADSVPHSSQPPASAFALTYRRLLEYREGIVSVHIAGAMSGTVQSARQAAREVDASRIRVIDACAVSVGTGLLVAAIGEAIAAGAGLDEIVDLAERVKAETRTFGAGAPARAMVVHTGDQAGADFVAARLRECLGAEVPVVRAGAVPTAHAGIGSVTVSVRRLPAT